MGDAIIVLSCLQDECLHSKNKHVNISAWGDPQATDLFLVVVELAPFGCDHPRGHDGAELGAIGVAGIMIGFHLIGR